MSIGNLKNRRKEKKSGRLTAARAVYLVVTYCMEEPGRTSQEIVVRAKIVVRGSVRL